MNLKFKISYKGTLLQLNNFLHKGKKPDSAKLQGCTLPSVGWLHPAALDGLKAKHPKIPKTVGVKTVINFKTKGNPFREWGPVQLTTQLTMGQPSVPVPFQN